MFPENVQHYIGYTHCYWLAGIEQISPGEVCYRDDALLVIT